MREQIDELVKEFIQKLDMEVTHETIETDGVFFINLETQDPGHLIGVAGAHLDALQHILRILVVKRMNQPCKIIVDVCGYKAQRSEMLLQDARYSAKQVKETGKIIIMQPMSSYERRLVHTELSKIEGIVTESIGEEPNRRIAIKPR